MNVYTRSSHTLTKGATSARNDHRWGKNKPLCHLSLMSSVVHLLFKFTFEVVTCDTFSPRRCKSRREIIKSPGCSLVAITLIYKENRRERPGILWCIRDILGVFTCKLTEGKPVWPTWFVPVTSTRLISLTVVSRLTRLVSTSSLWCIAAHVRYAWMHIA